MVLDIRETAIFKNKKDNINIYFMEMHYVEEWGLKFILGSSWCWPYSAFRVREYGNAVSTVPRRCGWCIMSVCATKCNAISRQLRCQSWPIELTQTYYIYGENT